MVTTLSSESANWILPSSSVEIASTLPNYEESLPVRVNHEGIANYLKNRGTLNIGDWETQCKRKPIPVFAEPTVKQINYNEAPPPKVLGAEAMRNYTRGHSSTPYLIHGVVDAPNPHHNMRVKREGLDNYEKSHNSQMKGLFENYGKFPLPPQPMPHTQGEMATNLYYLNKEGRMGPLFSNYGRFPPSPRPIPNLKGADAAMNLQRAQGDSVMLEHTAKFRPPPPEPHVSGQEAHLNYEAARGHSVDKLFHKYGKLPISARTPPKVTYGGVDNYIKAQGDAVRKIISQCPPSHRYIERPQSVPLYR